MPKWAEFFEKMGQRLESLELSWLDDKEDSDFVAKLVSGCPQLQVLKLKRISCLYEDSLKHIGHLQKLQTLSLTLTNAISTDSLTTMIHAIGPGLQRLSLHRASDADDRLLEVIHLRCRSLATLCITENDTLSDAAFAALFTSWKNPALVSINLTDVRGVDAAEPDGTEDSVGFASKGFKALMAHSRSRLETLTVKACRHISHEALCEVFNGSIKYPCLKEIDLTAVSAVDTTVIAGIFKSCPKARKVVAFGCFAVQDVVVPMGLALIGASKAQDSIVQHGGLTGMG